MKIPFIEWLPDRADLDNPGSTFVRGVRPHADGYQPLPQFSAYSSPLTERPTGGIYARSKADVPYTYVGTESDLHQLADGDWTNVSSGTGAYTTDSDGYWEFAKWNEDIIATNYANDMQKITMGGANFAAVGGGPPKARHIAVVRNFVVTGNTNDADGEVPTRVRWSAADDDESWTVSAATQADKEDLYGAGGWVQRVHGGEYGVVMQERSCWRMSYIGTPAIFQFDEVLPRVGLIAPGATAQYGDLIFFLSENGFYALENGSQATQIGANKVDRYVLNQIDRSHLDRVKSAVDPKRKHWYLAYPGSGSSNGQPNKLIIYDWSIGRWSEVETDSELIFESSSTGYTLDTLDNLSTSIDDLELTLDSPVYKGGPPEFAVFGNLLQMGFFASQRPFPAVIDTKEMQLSPGRRTMVNAVRPLVDGDGDLTLGVRVQVGTRQRQSDTVVYSRPSSFVNSNGRATLRSNARYHRFRLNLTGNESWDYAMGVEAAGDSQGWR